MDVAISKNRVPIRLTEERWQHISTGHPEVAGFYFEILETIENPSSIYEGRIDEFIAVSYRIEAEAKFLVVVYKEVDKADGFVLTAFISNQQQKFSKKKIIWKP